MTEKPGVSLRSFRAQKEPPTMQQVLSSEVRHEFTSLDPLAAEPVRIVPNEPPRSPPAQPLSAKARTAARRKYVRAPTRDLTRECELYVGSLIDAQVPMVTKRNWEREPEPDYCSPEYLAITNAVNAKHGWVWDAWRAFQEKGCTVAQRKEAERLIGPLARLAPIRHLIALANEPHKATDGEIEQAVEKLGAAVSPELRLVIADVALLLDLCAQVRELSKSTDERLYAIYEQLVDEEPTINTLVVNWCRDHKNTDAIYPPGHTRWHEADAAEVSP